MASRLLRNSKRRAPAECRCPTRLRPVHRRLEPPVATPTATMDIKNFSICLMTFPILRDRHTTNPILLRQPHPRTHTLPYPRHIVSAPIQTSRNSSSNIMADEHPNSKPSPPRRLIRESLTQTQEIRPPHLNRSRRSETHLTPVEVCWP